MTDEAYAWIGSTIIVVAFFVFLSVVIGGCQENRRYIMKACLDKNPAYLCRNMGLQMEGRLI